MNFLQLSKPQGTIRGNQRSFITLEGLRGVAAITIVMRHVGYFPSIFFESYLAVDFFFVLSGFVLSYAYAQKLRTNLSALEFLKIRIIRLYPLYALSLALTLATLTAGALVGKSHDDRLTAPIIAFSAFGLPTLAMWSAGLYPLNGAAWSLFFEMIANSWWAVVWKRIRDIHLAIFVLAAAALLTGAALSESAGFGSTSDSGVMDAGWIWGAVGAGILRVGYSFFCGILLHRIWTRRAHQKRMLPWVPRVVLVFILTAHPSAPYQAAFDLIATIFVFPLLVWLGANAPASGAVAFGFSMLGVASYGIYILQTALIELFRRGNHFVDPEMHNSILMGVICILFLFVATIFADRYFDRPIRNWLMTKLRSADPASRYRRPAR